MIRWYILSVVILISFLSYTSQYLFYYLDETHHLRRSPSQILIFNVLVLCIWICYYRACVTDPGQIPQRWEDLISPSHVGKNTGAGAVSRDNKRVEEEEDDDGGNGQRKRRMQARWCNKCQMPKPPRTHHCKECKQYAITTSIDHLNQVSLIYLIDISDM